MNKFIRDNSSTIFEYRIKALLAIPEVVGIIKKWRLSIIKYIDKMLKMITTVEMMGPGGPTRVVGN